METRPAFSRQGEPAPGRGTQERQSLAAAISRARQAINTKIPRSLEDTSKKNLSQIVASPVEFGGNKGEVWKYRFTEKGTYDNTYTYNRLENESTRETISREVPTGSYLFRPNKNSNPDKWARQAYTQKHIDDLMAEEMAIWRAGGEAGRAGIRTEKRATRIERILAKISAARSEIEKRQPIKNKNRMTTKTYVVVGPNQKYN